MTATDATKRTKVLEGYNQRYPHLTPAQIEQALELSRDFHTSQMNAMIEALKALTDANPTLEAILFLMCSQAMINDWSDRHGYAQMLALLDMHRATAPTPRAKV